MTGRECSLFFIGRGKTVEFPLKDLTCRRSSEIDFFELVHRQALRRDFYMVRRPAQAVSARDLGSEIEDEADIFRSISVNREIRICLRVIRPKF